jgi:hypothetical protein
MTAEVGIAFGGIRQVFTTRNLHTPGSEVAMQLVNGPFSRLDGQWRFQPLGDGSQRACRVELLLNYGFRQCHAGPAGRAGVRPDRLQPGGCLRQAGRAGLRLRAGDGGHRGVSHRPHASCT